MQPPARPGASPGAYPPRPSFQVTRSRRGHDAPTTPWGDVVRAATAYTVTAWLLRFRAKGSGHEVFPQVRGALREGAVRTRHRRDVRCRRGRRPEVPVTHPERGPETA